MCVKVQAVMSFVAVEDVLVESACASTVTRCAFTHKLGHFIASCEVKHLPHTSCPLLYSDAMLAACLHTYTQSELSVYLLLCQATVSRLPQRQLSRAACSFLTQLPWSPVIPFQASYSCTTSLWHNLHQAASKYHICYLSLNPQRWIMFVRLSKEGGVLRFWRLTKGHLFCSSSHQPLLSLLDWLFHSLYFYWSWNMTPGYLFVARLSSPRDSRSWRTFQRPFLNSFGTHVCRL